MIPLWSVRLRPLFAALCFAASACAAGTSHPSDTALRVIVPSLALATFDTVWSTIRESHYDPEMGGVDWDAARDAFRPRAAAARSSRALRGVLGEMLATLGESHYAVYPAEVVDADARSGSERGGGSGRVAVEIRVLEGAVVVTEVAEGSAAQAAGVRPGWIIEELGGVRSRDVRARLAVEGLGTDARELDLAIWRSFAGPLRGPAGSDVDAVMRDAADRRVRVRLLREPEAGEPVQLGNLPPLAARLTDRRLAVPDGNGIGLIGFNIWMTPIARAFDEALDRHRDADGIILDLRGNPGGVGGLVMGIGGHFFEEPLPLGRIVRRGSELRFAVNPRRTDAGNRPVAPYAGPVAILVDGLSASTSELLAGGMQAHGRARLFGERTAGQALPSVFKRLPNGDVLQHVVADLMLPDGTRIEGRGVVPDEAAPITRPELLAGRDPALLAAVAWIRAYATAGPRVLDDRLARRSSTTNHRY